VLGFTLWTNALLKHIGILPLLAFAFINGVLIRKTKALSLYNPFFLDKSWNA
jgi:hypothetical protein